MSRSHPQPSRSGCPRPVRSARPFVPKYEVPNGSNRAVSLKVAVPVHLGLFGRAPANDLRAKPAVSHFPVVASGLVALVRSEEEERCASERVHPARNLELSWFHRSVLGPHAVRTLVERYEPLEFPGGNALEMLYLSYRDIRCSKT